jgi:glycosyltransferase involved in cell wall biosynthesis
MKDHFKQVLYIGPHYSLRGGMASVLKVYAQSIKPFNFIAGYYYLNPVAGIFYFLWALIKLFWTLLTKREIKIVHLQSASRGSFFRKSVMILLSKMFGKKTVLHIHGGEFKIFFNNAGVLKNYIRYILNSADEVICLSDEWKVYFDSLTDKKNAIVLNNPVIFPAESIQKKAAFPVKVLYLNHINKAKGIFDVLDFIKENENWLADSFAFEIAGAGDNQLLEHFISTNKLGDLIEYKGWIEGEEKDNLIKNCDVFILTSYNEGLPMSILEAMVYKKAIISTNVGGIPRIVKPGENGWLITPGNKEGLKAVFEEIKNHKDILGKYGERSYQNAADYSPSAVKEKLGRIYEAVLRKKIPAHELRFKENKHAETETH